MATLGKQKGVCQTSSKENHNVVTTLTLICRPIYEHLRADHITERNEHLHKLSIPEFLRKMVNEEVAAYRRINNKCVATF